MRAVSLSLRRPGRRAFGWRLLALPPAAVTRLSSVESFVEFKNIGRILGRCRHGKDPSPVSDELTASVCFIFKNTPPLQTGANTLVAKFVLLASRRSLSCLSFGLVVFAGGPKAV